MRTTVQRVITGKTRKCIVSAAANQRVVADGPNRIVITFIGVEPEAECAEFAFFDARDHQRITAAKIDNGIAADIGDLVDQIDPANMTECGKVNGFGGRVEIGDRIRAVIDRNNEPVRTAAARKCIVPGAA